jgi:hypothetical protein
MARKTTARPVTHEELERASAEWCRRGQDVQALREKLREAEAAEARALKAYKDVIRRALERPVNRATADAARQLALCHEVV